MGKYQIMENVKVGDRCQQKRSKRICIVIKVGKDRIQYLYEDLNKKGTHSMQYHSAGLLNFKRKFIQIAKVTVEK